MNTVLLQIWEETSSDITLPNGCSLHVDINENISYLKMRYKNRILSKRYESAVCQPIEVNINDVIFNILKKEKTIHLNQNEFNNLIELGDITI